jgi:hypothetical protein
VKSNENKTENIEEALRLMKYTISEIARILNVGYKFVIRTQSRPVVFYKHALIYLIISKKILRYKEIANFLSLDRSMISWVNSNMKRYVEQEDEEIMAIISTVELIINS